MVRAQSIRVPSSNPTCADAFTSTTYLADTLSLSPAVLPGPQSVAGGSWASWSTSPGTYTIQYTGAPGYAPRLACWQTTNPAQSDSAPAATVGSSDTLTWKNGYAPPGSWFQAKGADVYASATLRSFIPEGVKLRAFILDDAGSPGVATYGTDYTFDPTGVTKGQTWVSSINWLVQDANAATDFYQLLYQKFGSPTAESALSKTSLTKPASGTYDLKGGVATDTSSLWALHSGKTAGARIYELIYILD